MQTTLETQTQLIARNKMFLIEFDEGLYINGEDINWVGIRLDSMKFTMKNDSDRITYTVTEDYRDRFINNLQAINNGIQCVDSAWHELKSTNAT